MLMGTRRTLGVARALSAAAYTRRCATVTDTNVLRGPAATTPDHEDLVALMMARFQKWSRRPAIECVESGRRYTYGEVTDWLLRWARVVQRTTEGSPGPVTVALLMRNIPEFPALFLGSLAAGATICPISYNFTAAEVAHVLSEVELSLVVVEPQLEARLMEVLPNLKREIPVFVTGTSTHGHPNLLTLLDDATAPLLDPVENEGRATATLMFSSGTTGLPKAVQSSHAAISYNVVSVTDPRFYVLQPTSDEDQEAVLGVLPNYHVGGYITLLFHLYQGAKVMNFPNFMPQHFTRVIREEKVGYMVIVPTILHFLATSAAVTSRDLASVRALAVGAAPVLPTIANALMDKAPNLVTFQEVYGMTEVLLSHFTPINEQRVGWCGCCLPGVEAKVVDEAGQALPQNQEGELLVRSPSVMTGYLNNEEATRAALTPDGWLRTGDVALHHHGFFSIVDRTKDLIKVKGLQVSPSEVEDVLLQHPAVADAAVVGVADERMGELPRAYLVLRPETPAAHVSQDALNQFLAPHLAPYKLLQGGVRVLDTLPKNQTGKTLRKDLRAMAAQEL